MTNKEPNSTDNNFNLFNFEEYFQGLFQFRYWIIGLSLISSIIVITFGLFQTPIYKASVKLMTSKYALPQIKCQNDLRDLSACARGIPRDELVMHSSIVEEIMNSFANENINNPIEIINHQNNTISIISTAESIAQAKKSLEKVLSSYILENNKAIDNIKLNWRDSIQSLQDKIGALYSFEINPIKEKSKINENIFDRNIKINEEKISSLETKLSSINDSLDNLYKMIEKKLIVEQDSQSVAKKLLDSSIALIDEKTVLYENYNYDNNNILKTYQEHLKKINSNQIDQSISQSTQISKLKQIIFEINEQIIILKAEKQKLLYQHEINLESFADEKKLLNNVYANFNSIGSSESQNSIDSKIFEFKNLLINLTNQQSSFINEINNEQLLLLTLKDEQSLFLNYTKPKYKKEELLVEIEINNLNKKLSEYNELLLPAAFTDVKLLTKIKAPKKQFSPNMTLYTMYGFFGSLSLFVFLFSIINLFRFSIKT
ncbi:hypothetical protein OAN85_01380 [Candidatus Pseudothioglobus singularis]|nr:hypothetical protein [Candidatus Pseudothioglobus singularis]